MASRIELLISELFDAIIDNLDPSDLAKLLVCSKHLQQRIEPALYGPKDAYNRAMRWACLNGNLATLRQAISYGASISTVETPYARSYARLDGNTESLQYDTKPVKVLTLYLAAKRSRANAFNLLLELGAQVDDTDVDLKELKNLMKRLCAADNWILLRAFLEARLDSQVKMRHCVEIAWPLLLIIKSGAPLDIVQTFLDRGANPNHVHHPWYHGHICPLSAAIIANSAPLFDLLVAKGASIHGKDIRYSREKVSHIPVLAAAEVMPKYGIAMMQLCLDNGADINHRASIFNQRFECYYTTPLLVYLGSISTWKGEARLSPIDGLLYLFEHGALIKSPEEVPNAHLLLGLRCKEAPSSIEFLLNKWGLAELLNPEFLAVVKLLIQRGADNPSRMLAKYDHYIKAGDKKSEVVMAGWQNFLSILLEDPQVDVNMLLAQLILDRGEECYKLRERRGIGGVYRATIDRLISAGADINAPVMPEGCTVLHKLCRLYSSVTWQNVHYTFHPSMPQTHILFSLLVSKGADPMISFNGKTAIEALTSKAGDLGTRNNTFVLSLAGVLRGEFGSEL